MEIDSEDIDDEDKVLELEDTSPTIEEAQTYVVTSSADEVSCQKLLNFTSPKVAL